MFRGLCCSARPSTNGLWQGLLYQAIGAAMWQIRAERPSDDQAVERLVNSAFGPGRFAKTAYRLREGVAPEPGLAFVAEDGKAGALLGGVRFWPTRWGTMPSLCLGPP